MKTRESGITVLALIALLIFVSVSSVYTFRLTLRYLRAVDAKKASEEAAREGKTKVAKEPVAVVTQEAPLKTDKGSIAEVKAIDLKEPVKQAAQETPKEENKESAREEPMVVNGDTVEYLTEGKQVSATGHVSIIFKGSKLTCQKILVNTQTKEGEAEGDVRLESPKGVITGSRMKYNFQTQSGEIIDAGFKANPFFGRSEKIEKVSDEEFVSRRGYMTTCDFDKPHWRMKSARMDMFPDDKIQSKDDTVYIGSVPVLYAPQFNKSLKDPLMHVQLMPGSRKDWGPYMLSAWRYNITDAVKGRIYLDYRSKLGVSEGAGTNYAIDFFGKGDIKFYYTQERDKSSDVPEEVTAPKVFERYLLRWRHQADIDAQTKLTGEYYKIKDAKMQLYPGGNFNFLKDYFYREFEKDAQPPTYLLLHRVFNYSSVDFFLQGRTNDWYSPGYVEKLPEIEYNFPSYQVGESPFYFSDSSSMGNYNKKNQSTDPAQGVGTPDTHVNRFDSSNRISIPMKVAFVSFSPYVMNRETFYDCTVPGNNPVARTIFYSGADMSTKFYRIFNVKTNALGLDLNGLRHIITPTVGYAFNKEPTITSVNLKQIDEVDSITRNNGATLQLSNKLQTKRNNQSVDLVDFLVTSAYNFKPKTGERGSSLSDLLFQLKLIPYSWMSINSDATYVHSGARDNVNYNRFSNANIDIGISFGEDRTISIGQRYQLKGGNQITGNIKWRLNPKWKVSIYERYNRGHDPTLGRGIREQEYTLSRDLHCWVCDVTYRTQKGHGDGIYFLFRLKAFPELEMNFGQSYRAPQPGSQNQAQMY